MPQRVCFGFARFTGVGPRNAPGRGALGRFGIRPVIGTAAVDPAIYSLPLPGDIAGNEQVQEDAASFFSNVSIYPQGYDPHGGPEPPFTLSDFITPLARMDVRGPVPTIDVYRFSSDAAARQITGIYFTIIVQPARITCPQGFVE